LVHADYYSENERVEGQWLGKAAELLKLGSGDFNEEFAKLGKHEAPHPEKGENAMLGQRKKADAVSYYDLGLSAPKDFSVLAVVGDNSVLKELFEKEAKETVSELEKFAARRWRTGDKARSEEKKVTGNIAAAMFIHEASRSLDPQLHAHIVTANVTYDEAEGKWYALEKRRMLEASVYIRQKFYHRLAHGLEELGYRTHNHTDSGFEIHGVEELRERFSQRTLQIEEEMEKYRQDNGKEPSKKAVALMSLDTRDRKLTESSKELIAARNLGMLSKGDLVAFQSSAEAHQQFPRTPVSNAAVAVKRGMEHEFERRSVSLSHEVLNSAFRLNTGLIIDDVSGHLEDDPDVVFGESGFEMTYNKVVQEELDAIESAQNGLDSMAPLGDLQVLEGKLEALEAKMNEAGLEAFKRQNDGALPSPAQEATIRARNTQDELRAVGRTLLSSQSRVSVLIGDAGTGKTFGMNILQEVHLLTGGDDFRGVAPTSLARKQLEEEGTVAQTLQKFLVATNEQEKARGKTLLLDEAGLVGTQEMAKFLRIAEDLDARVVLVGDTKQHEAVTRGNALRNITEGVARIPIARLSRVRRQEKPSHSKISELLSQGRFSDAINRQKEAGQLVENPDEDALFQAAAKEYADSVIEGKSPLVVITTWKEIDVFTEKARAELRKNGVLTGDDVQRTQLKSRNFTDEEKGAFQLYRKGDVLAFHKPVKGIAKGEQLKVVEHKGRGIVAISSAGKTLEITRRQRKALDVLETKPLPLATGDKVMLRANIDNVGLNGEIMEVLKISREGEVLLKNSKGAEIELPAGENRITHGHAVTSHRSQGLSTDHTISVMGARSTNVVNPRQFLVSNTRYKKSHRLFVYDKERLRNGLMRKAEPTKLGREVIPRKIAYSKQWNTQRALRNQKAKMLIKPPAPEKGLLQKAVARFAKVAQKINESRIVQIQKERIERAVSRFQRGRIRTQKEIIIPRKQPRKIGIGKASTSEPISTSQKQAFLESKKYEHDRTKKKQMEM